MELVYIITLVLFLLYSVVRERNIYNPSTLFVGIWLLVGFLASLRLFGLNETSVRAYSLALAGVVAFCFGTGLRRRIRIQTHVTAGDHKSDNFVVNYQLLIVLFVIALLFTGVMASRSVRLILRGTSMSVIRNNYRNIEAGLVVDSSFTYYVEQYFVAALEFATVAIFPIVLFDKKSFSKYVLLFEMILFLVLHIFVTGARSFLIDVVIVLVLYTLMSRQLIRRFGDYFRKIPKFVFVLVAVGAIALVVVMSQMRKGEVRFAREIYMYFSIPFPLFDQHLKLMDNADSYTYGMTLLNGLLRPFLLVLRKLGMPYPSLYRLASQLLSDNNIYYSVGQTRANSFVTLFYSFYTDFGAAGIVLGCLGYGYLAQSTYFSMMKNPNRRSQAIYLLIGLGLFLSFAKLQFVGYRYLYAFLFIWFAFREGKSTKPLSQG